MSIIKITKKEEPWEALKWDGSYSQNTIDEINKFISPKFVYVNTNCSLSLLGGGSGGDFPLYKDEYIFKAPNGTIGKITQEIIDRSWNIESDENIAEKILIIRNSLYDNLPSGKIESWDLLILIKQHINNLDELYDELK